jgi:hypothetical protein
MYVRVTLVTLKSEHVPVHCIHPYAIDTSEKDVIHDANSNALYFRITHDEMRSGEKR